MKENLSHSQDQPAEEAVREWVYQHLNNGGFGLSPRDAHKLLLSLFNNLNISMKGATVGEGQEDWKEPFRRFITNDGRHRYIDNSVVDAIIDYVVNKVLPKTKREKE